MTTARRRADQAAEPGNAEELLAYSIAKMKEYGIVDLGDALTLASAP